MTAVRTLTRDTFGHPPAKTAPGSGENVPEFFVAAGSRPSEGVATVQVVEHERVCAECEHGDDRSSMSVRIERTWLLTAAQVSGVPRYGSASTRAPSSSSSRTASTRSDFAAQTSASSRTSCGSSEGCQARKPPWGR